jgi:predicted regulator of Ras-like GTPase activity (Roadblock/LC7/MglB family)
MKRTMAAKQPAVDDAVPDLFTKRGEPAAAAVTAGAPPTGRPAPGPQASTSEQSASSAKAAGTKATLALNLAALCTNWPENVRKEIDRFKLGSLTLGIPFDAIEAGLRYGKVDFLWKQVCGWLQGRPEAVPMAATADTRVELPLNVVAPLFLKHRPSPKQNKRSDLAANIPDLFSGGPVPPSPPPAAAPAESVPLASAAPPSSPPEPTPAPAAKKPPQDIAELFGEPDKRNWTPNEIVHRTSALPGVAGTLIALQDGLLVAQCMPPEWKTETVAAFLPQIFGRMSQYTKELKMGDVKNITLVVEQGVLQIFAAGIIYFAALAKTGAQLPQLELNLIATELSRHTK